MLEASISRVGLREWNDACDDCKADRVYYIRVTSSARNCPEREKKRDVVTRIAEIVNRPRFGT